MGFFMVVLLRLSRFAGDASPRGRAIAAIAGARVWHGAPLPVNSCVAPPHRPCIRDDAPHIPHGVIADPYDRHAPGPERPSLET